MYSLAIVKAVSWDSEAVHHAKPITEKVWSKNVVASCILQTYSRGEEPNSRKGE